MKARETEFITWESLVRGEVPFYCWLKACRKAHDLTQGELGRRVGCAAETVRKVEAGRRRPSRQLVELLAMALGVPPIYVPVVVQAARTTHTAIYKSSDTTPRTHRVPDQPQRRVLASEGDGTRSPRPDASSDHYWADEQQHDISA